MVPSAVLDACVLYPIGLRDTLLNVAEAGLFRVLWTDEILAETARNIGEDTSGLTAAHLEKTFAAMRRAFPEAMVHGHEPLAESMTNHPKDRHVLAAAVAARADVVVTVNLRHFLPGFRGATPCETPPVPAASGPSRCSCGSTAEPGTCRVLGLVGSPARPSAPASGPLRH